VVCFLRSATTFSGKYRDSVQKRCQNFSRSPVSLYIVHITAPWQGTATPCEFTAYFQREPSRCCKMVAFGSFSRVSDVTTLGIFERDSPQKRIHHRAAEPQTQGTRCRSGRGRSECQGRTGVSACSASATRGAGVFQGGNIGFWASNSSQSPHEPITPTSGTPNTVVPYALQGGRGRRARMNRNGAFRSHIRSVCRFPAWRRQNAYATFEPNPCRKTAT
jgi:hypothetical protein